MDAYRQTLRRTGAVLIAVGVLDIGYMAYSIANGYSYSSSFNIFAVVAGAFLLKGNLTAVRIVTWLAAFMLAGFACASLILFPFIKPLGLWMAEFRLYPGQLIFSFVMGIGVFVLIFWVYFQLRTEAVVTARIEAGQPSAPPKLAFALGLVAPVCLTVIMHLALGGEVGRKAIELAKTQNGDDYSYHVASLNWSGGHVWAQLAAYNASEIKTVEVEWEQ